MARKHGKKLKVDVTKREIEFHSEKDRQDLTADTGRKHRHHKRRVRGNRENFVETRKAWKGDDEYELLGRESDYALWYDFLLRAHRDKHVKLKYEIYDNWALDGLTIQETLEKYNTANKWIYRMFRRSKRWQDLFGIQRRGAVEKVEVGEVNRSLSRSIEESGDVLLRICFSGKSKDDIDRQLAIVLRDELKARGRGTGKAVTREGAKFSLTAGKGIDSLTFRRTIAIADLEKKPLKDGKKLAIATYFAELNKGRKKAKGRKLRRGKFEELHLADGRDSENYEGVYKIVLRDRSRYEKVLKNVAKGSFPGKYT